ncbi:MAG: adenosine deaminase [Porcipelethomonas sp.]
MKRMKIVISMILSSLVSPLLIGCGTVSNTGLKVEKPSADKYALIDLHLHLDGSLSVASARNLAELQGIEIDEDDNEIKNKLQVSEDCRDLNEYLEKFDFPCSLLQTEEAIAQAVYTLEEELKEQGLIYAEIRFAPQKHCDKGLTQSEVIEAAIEGMNRSDFKSNLILCCMRGDDNHEQNMETVREAKNYLGRGVCAVDLAGAEALFPTADFEELFSLARELEIPYTIHAGEADGPESVYKALEFGTSRIGHGVNSIKDEALVKKLSDEGVTLEVCPTSNLNTNIFSSISEIPIREFIEAGVRVTINTDNMTVSGVTLRSEFQKLIDAFSLTPEVCRTLVNNAVEASFADDETKEWLRTEAEKRMDLR